MTFTESEVTALGFVPTVPDLPHIFRSYEKTLPSGNIINLGRPGKDTPQHVATEFAEPGPLRAVRLFRIHNADELAQLAAGTLTPFHTF